MTLSLNEIGAGDIAEGMTVFSIVTGNIGEIVALDTNTDNSYESELVDIRWENGNQSVLAPIRGTVSVYVVDDLEPPQWSIRVGVTDEVKYQLRTSEMQKYPLSVSYRDYHDFFDMTGFKTTTLEIVNRWSWLVFESEYEYRMFKLKFNI